MARVTTAAAAHAATQHAGHPLQKPTRLLRAALTVREESFSLARTSKRGCGGTLLSLVPA